MASPIVDIRVVQFWLKVTNENGEEGFQPANYSLEVQREGSEEWERLEIINQMIEPPPTQ